MRITTKDFGEIEVSQENILYFPQGVFAFEDTKEYVLLNYTTQEQEGAVSPGAVDDGGPVKSLQSVSGEVCFTVVDPCYFLPGYRPSITEKDKRILRCEDEGQLRYLVIAVVGAQVQDTVVNLRCPIVMNAQNRQAAQIVLENTQYPIKYPLFLEGDVT